MSNTGWKQFERRVARLLGTERIPVTGERNGADAETPMFAIQMKKRARLPRYLFTWLDGIRAAAAKRGKIGVLVMQRPRDRGLTALDLDSVVVVSLRDWLDLHGPTPRVGEEQP